MSHFQGIPMYDDAALLSLARETPLPGDATENRASTAEPITPHRPNVSSSRVGLPTPRNPLPVPRRLKRRAPLADIEIFADPNGASRPAKKSATARKDGRTPLGERKDFGNTCPRTPTVTPQFTPSIEDWNRFAHWFTPPPTPRPSPQPRIVRPARVTEPACMILYSFLEIPNWKATTEEIKTAFKKVAVKYHPDKVEEHQKADAHDNMLCINASRDVLLDKAARSKYHKDGKLPRVFAQVFPDFHRV
ncbi:uncharacterized protein N0V89_008149 [Didymosphaeria variabile]|uniref:J domain-containing protein n=1 Tax=Didymosphaeria variabile TaxID=1932322 RepID=A0A9W8XFP8_9PLEO|nr:uncharacterized protein N0V89_008149 [Didymosphaeria variabile]KAJ4349533.1 hypothetical protein N0V89_008149 [Didymosphaeria variabile]